MNNPFIRLIIFLKSFWKYFFVSAVSTLVITLLNIPTPYFTKILVDDALFQDDFNLAASLLLILALVNLFSGFLNFANRLYSSATVIDIKNYVSLKFSRHLFRQSHDFYNKKQVGEIISRTGDVTRALTIVSIFFEQTFQNLCYLLIFPPILFLINWKLMILGIIGLPLELYLIALAKRIQEKYTKIMAIERADISAISIENLNCAKAIYLLNIRDARYDALESKIIALKATMFRQKIALAGINFSLQFSQIFFKLIYGLVGWYMIIVTKSLTLGTFLAFSIYLGYLYRPIQHFMGLITKYAEAMVYARRFFEYYDFPPDHCDSRKRSTADILSGSLNVSNLQFSYDDTEDILKNVNLTFSHNSLNLIIGPSGCGKTTFLELLSGWIKSYRGTIKWVDKSIVDYDKLSLMDTCGVLFQIPVLFRGSIYENICLFNCDVPISSVMYACKKCQIHDFIDSLPNGYHTQVEEMGTNLSVGQKQRICLARLIAQNKRVLFLDEPTSSLDQESSRLIEETLIELKKNCMVIISTHNLKLLKVADQVIFFGNNHEIMSGTHCELLGSSTDYDKFVQEKAYFER